MYEDGYAKGHILSGDVRYQKGGTGGTLFPTKMNVLERGPKIIFLSLQLRGRVTVCMDT